MVKAKFQDYFPSKPNTWTYSCLHCRAHLARHEDLISKSFQGSQGRAYLFNQVVNVDYSEAKQRVLLTGVHFVADVFCACCNVMLGWRYERALEPSQRYKEGKVIMELVHLIKDNCWDTEWLSPKRSSCFTDASPTGIHHPSTLPHSLTHTAVPISRSQRPPPSNPSSPSSWNAVSPGPSTCSTVPMRAGLSPDDQNRLPSSVYFSSLASSSTTSYDGVPYLLDRHILSPGPSSCGSSCCGRTPDQELWHANPLLSFGREMSVGTAAQGVCSDSPARSDSSSPKTDTATTVCSVATSKALPVEDALDDNPRRSTNCPQPLNLQLAFGVGTSSIGVSNTVVHKHRVRLRTPFIARRTSSSSPSRAFLLPLASDDESGQSTEDLGNPSNVVGP